MALDTNAKEFKYSAVKKIICIVLCFVTFMVSAGMAAFTFMSIDYCDGDRPESFIDSGQFKSRFAGCIDYAATDAYRPVAANAYREEMNKYKEDAVNNIYNQYLIEKDNDNDDSYYQTTIKSSHGSFTFEVFRSNLDENNDKTIKYSIENEYADFVNDLLDDYLLELNYPGYYGYYYNSGIKYYTTYGKNVSTNINDINDFDVKDVYNHDYYFVYKNGKIESKGMSDDTIEYVNSYLIDNAYAEKCTVYAYLSFPLDEIKNPSTIDYFENYNDMQGLRDFHDTALKIYNHIVLYLVIAVVMLILSFVLGFRYFGAAGRRFENEPAKLAFIDYIPFEIHLAASVGLGAGATILFDLAAEGLTLSKLLAVCIVIYAAALWLLLFEFSASVARYIKSDKKLYKNFLVYYIFRFLIFVVKKLWKLDVKIFKAIGRLFKKMRASAKNTFSVLSYQPTKFRKNVITIAVIYALCNLVALLIGGILWSVFAEDMHYGGPDFFTFIVTFGYTIADIGVNVYLFKKVLQYIQNLDIIIDSASKHEDISLEIDTLPQSLKTLAESMKYTNAELQAAVAKAVKDERLKTELITNVSHDLKTPLTSIITYVDLLSKCDIQDEKAQEYIRVLDDKGAKLKRLIDDLIEASKVNSGNITVNLSNLNLYELCLQATVDAQADFEKADLELIVKESDDVPTIFADGPKSFRIVENLLSNARKYSAKHSRVYVSVYKENGMGIFEIKNVSAQPLDISPDELTQRFVRGDKSRNQEGNGLGLSIAKELCRVQKGDLEISIDGDLFKAKAKLPLAE